VRAASGFSESNAIHQDKCHSKMDAAVCTVGRRPNSQQMSACQARVSDPETCEGDFVLPEGSEELPSPAQMVPPHATCCSEHFPILLGRRIK
jgi:hypothetical protein